MAAGPAMVRTGATSLSAPSDFLAFALLQSPMSADGAGIAGAKAHGKRFRDLRTCVV